MTDRRVQEKHTSCFTTMPGCIQYFKNTNIYIFYHGGTAINILIKQTRSCVIVDIMVEEIFSLTLGMIVKYSRPA